MKTATAKQAHTQQADRLPVGQAGGSGSPVRPVVSDATISGGHDGAPGAGNDHREKQTMTTKAKNATTAGTELQTAIHGLEGATINSRFALTVAQGQLVPGTKAWAAAARVEAAQDQLAAAVADLAAAV